MYKRKIETSFQNWKKSENRKPLVIKGVRQCGKTSSVLKFAKEHYKEVIYIDFHQQPQLKSIFNGSLDINYLTVAISAAIPSAIFEPYNNVLYSTKSKTVQKQGRRSNFSNLMVDTM